MYLGFTAEVSSFMSSLQLLCHCHTKVVSSKNLESKCLYTDNVPMTYDISQSARQEFVHQCKDKAAMRAELMKLVKGLRLPDTSIEEVVVNTPDSHLYLNIVGDRCASSVCSSLLCDFWCSMQVMQLTRGCGRGL